MVPPITVQLGIVIVSLQYKRRWLAWQRGGGLSLLLRRVVGAEKLEAVSWLSLTLFDLVIELRVNYSTQCLVIYIAANSPQRLDYIPGYTGL